MKQKQDSDQVAKEDDQEDPEAKEDADGLEHAEIEIEANQDTKGNENNM